MNYILKLFCLQGQLFFNAIYKGINSPVVTDTVKGWCKLIKQHLLDDFWWYFINGASGWNCIFCVIFTLPIGTPNIWYVFVLSPLSLAWYSFYRNMVNALWNFLLTTDDQDWTNILFMTTVLGSYNVLSYLFYLYHLNTFCRS